MKQTIYFGLSFDDAIMPRPRQTAGFQFLGEKKLLQFLEGQLGLGGHIERIEHIRKEQYRQALTKHLKINSKDAPFTPPHSTPINSLRLNHF
ncbi:MAG: hypothetical protein HC817_13280 [Saprospiraceae bacterium]|nr:hypothetical protein [Saprospiraceae bacterium]